MIDPPDGDHISIGRAHPTKLADITLQHRRYKLTKTSNSATPDRLFSTSMVSVGDIAREMHKQARPSLQVSNEGKRRNLILNLIYPRAPYGLPAISIHD